MGKALYRKYRSRSLDEVSGQDHVTGVLQRAIERGSISHAYLFTGPRGVGKTSIARILAHEINGLTYDEDSQHLDIVEIDAASNNGVDDIRDLREKVSIAPTSAYKKIYIIDEVHMLSKAAFNALLKTLEEPPAHVVFILATTDVDKVPDTILSRTQRYTFKRASHDGIVSLLARIAKSETISIDDGALALIARHSDGSYRDSVSLLDQISSVSDSITTEDVENALGLAPEELIETLLDGLTKKDFDTTISSVKKLRADGFQAAIIADQIITAIENDPKKYQPILQIIDALIPVASSRLPDTLLLSVLASYAAEDHTTVTTTEVATTKPRPKATVVTPKKQPEVIEALVVKATEEHPVDDIVIAAPQKKRVITNIEGIDWDEIAGSTAHLPIGLRTVLSKCTLSASEDGTVTVYTRGEFYRKKLDTPKYRQELTEFLREKTNLEWELEFIPSLPPSKNQTIASVTAIMGGGEEVSL